jgi:hypothetical protein
MNRNIIWIASFPKSGNTWTRFLLNALLHRKFELTDLNTDAKISGACTSKSLLESFLSEKVDITERLMDRASVLRKLSESQEPGKILLMKTHSALVEYMKTPQLPLDVTKAAVLVVRNPFDVLCSCMNHFGFDQEQAFSYMDKISSSISETDKHLPVLTTSWDGYTKSWLTNSKFPLLLLRYEDLMSHPFTQATRICKFFKLTPTENEIIAAIQATSFENMQKLETDQGFREASAKGERFFFKGEVGYYKDILSQETIDKVAFRFGDSMKKVGYEYVDGNLLIHQIKVNQNLKSLEQLAN